MLEHFRGAGLTTDFHSKKLTVLCPRTLKGIKESGHMGWCSARAGKGQEEARAHGSERSHEAQIAGRHLFRCFSYSI